MRLTEHDTFLKMKYLALSKGVTSFRWTGREFLSGLHVGLGLELGRKMIHLSHPVRGPLGWINGC